MRDYAKQLNEIARIASAIAIDVWLNNKLADWFPAMPTPVLYLLGLVIAATAAWAIWFFIFSRPVVAVRWLTVGQAHTLDGTVPVVLDENDRTGRDVLQIDVQVERRIGAAGVVLWYAARQGLTILIRAPHGPFAMTVEDSSGPLQAPYASIPDPSMYGSCAVKVTLPPPVGDNVWGTTTIRFQGMIAPRENTYELRHEAIVSGKFGRLLGRVIHLEPSVGRLQERWVN
jgi:hypothetical protein